MEVELCGLEKAVFEVVEVEKYTVSIKGWGGIAVGEVQFACATNLYVRQLADSALQQLLFFQRIATACLATATDSVEKRNISQVGLQVTQFIVADGQDLGYGKLTLGEVTCQIDEGMVLVTTCTYAPHDTGAVG